MALGCLGHLGLRGVGQHGQAWRSAAQACELHLGICLRPKQCSGTKHIVWLDAWSAFRSLLKILHGLHRHREEDWMTSTPSPISQELRTASGCP